MLVTTPCLESEAAINHVTRLHHTEVTEAGERALIPNYTPWWGAVVSPHDSLQETID